MTHILIPREPSTALLRPFIGCNTQELHEAWAAMVRIAEVQHARAGRQCLQQIEEGPQSVDIAINHGTEDLAMHSLSTAPAAVAGPADELAELAMLNKLIELGAKASYAHAKSNSDDGPAGTAAYVQWQELRAEMGELIRAHVAPALEAPAAPPPRTTGYIAPKGRYVPPVLFDPYTGEPRDARDIASDPQGVLIVPPGAAIQPVREG